MSRRIQVHYAVVVELDIDDDGIHVHGTPYIDPEVAVGYDGNDAWDATNDEWCTAEDPEWDAGADAIRAITTAIDRVARALDGQRWDADALDNIAEAVRDAGRDIRALAPGEERCPACDEWYMVETPTGLACPVCDAERAQARG